MIIKRFLLLALLAALAVAAMQIGCDELITEQTTIIEAGHPISDFSLIDPPNGLGCVPCTAIFQDLSDGPRQIYTWNFGDSNDDSILVETLPANLAEYESPQHIYTVPGVYTVSLTVEDTTRDDRSEDIQIYPRLVTVGLVPADFIAAPNTVCTGEEVEFVLDEYSNENTYKWVFGDGTDTVTGLNPSHAYEAEGVYTCTLIASDICGTNMGTAEVEVNQCPEVGFSADVTQGCPPFDVTFTNSTNLFGKEFISRQWTFGDGQNSQDREPVHTYETTGPHTVTLTVTTSAGQSSLTMPDYITGDVSTVAGFDIEGDASFCFSPTQDFQVNFQNQSTGILDSVRWYFGDGGTSTLTDPVYIYTTPGIYTVELMTYGLCNGDTLTATDYIVLSDVLLDENVVIDTTLFSGTGAAPTEITFTDASTVGVITGRAWYLDEGTTPLVENVVEFTHLFDAEGTYTIRLVVSNDCGTATNTFEVNIAAP